jgi:hypothetical protein
MKPVTVIQDKGNGFLLACCRTGSVIERKHLMAKITDLPAAIAEAQACFPGREIVPYLPAGFMP